MTNHTPGPWTYHKCGCGHPHCNKFRIDHSGAEGMFEAVDARLIAAAPDMLEALEAVLDDSNAIHCMDMDVYNKARTVVAKAKGEA